MPAIAGLSSYLADKLIDHSNGVSSYTMPTVYVALIQATAGQSPRSTAVTSGQTTVPASLNGHMYRCSTAGTTGSGEPTWPTTSAGTVTDGTAVWTEMTPDFQANNTHVTGNECSYTGYARVALSGLMGSASAGSAANTSAVPFGADTGGTNDVGAICTYDASSAGNLLKFCAPCFLAIGSGVTPSAAIGALVTAMV
jgi:hypothetical protein